MITKFKERKNKVSNKTLPELLQEIEALRLNYRKTIQTLRTQHHRLYSDALRQQELNRVQQILEELKH